MRVLCFGDSNTYGFDPRSYFGGRYAVECRWVNLLASACGWEILNAGENGRAIPKSEQEIQRVNQMLSDYSPLDVLIIMLGSNDLLQGATPAEVACDMERFILQISFPRTRTFLLAPPPMKCGTWVAEEHLLDDSVLLSEHYRRLADRAGICFIDTRNWNIDLTYDGVHFSENGHKTFAEKLYQALKQYKSPSRTI